MKLIDQIRGSFPTTIDKSKPVFSSLIANDKNNAVIQKQIIDLQQFMKEWISTPDIYEQTGVMLTKTVKFFSYLERFADETETSLKNRFRAIFVRNHDTRWGTAYDVKNVFRQYFPHAEIYLVENVNKIDSVVSSESNFLEDGDITTSSPTDWTLTDCSATKEARFSKNFGIEMNTSGGTLSQTVTIPNRKQIGETENYKSLTYFLHFFISGKANVQIYNSSNSKYWDYAHKEWKSTAVNNTFESAEWNDCSLYFITEGDDDETDITVTFIYDILPADMQNMTLLGKLPATWTYSNCTVLDNIITLYQSDSSVSTTANIVGNQSYDLSLFYRGKISVVIQNNNNKYWDFETKRWSSTLISNVFRANTWTDTVQSFITDDTDTSVTITINYIDSTAYIQNPVINGVLPASRTLTDCTLTTTGINLSQQTSKVSYTANLEPLQSYNLKYILNGRLGIVIKNNNDEYYDLNTNKWESSLINNEYMADKDNEINLNVKANENTTQITVDFMLFANYLDYFRLFQKQPYSSFTVVAHFTGNTSVGAFGLAAGDEDPNISDSGENPPQPRYGNYGYYDKSFLSGVPIGFASDIYEDLLDYLRSQGVKAFLEIVIKDA